VVAGAGDTPLAELDWTGGVAAAATGATTSAGCEPADWYASCRPAGFAPAAGLAVAVEAVRDPPAGDAIPATCLIIGRPAQCGWYTKLPLTSAATGSTIRAPAPMAERLIHRQRLPLSSKKIIPLFYT
jgi:hypothetical protein